MLDLKNRQALATLALKHLGWDGGDWDGVKGLVVPDVTPEETGDLDPRDEGVKKALIRAAAGDRKIPVGNEYPSSSSSMIRNDTSGG